MGAGLLNGRPAPAPVPPRLWPLGSALGRPRPADAWPREASASSSATLSLAESAPAGTGSSIGRAAVACRSNDPGATGCLPFGDSPAGDAEPDDCFSSVAEGYSEEDTVQREFLQAASLLSEDELREFVDDHISSELVAIRAMPSEQRGQAFRSLCAEWHPDKCPAIAGLATEVFQRLQAQKTKILHLP
mmetsp:Transcript_89479/g.191782  ORF Transcript_89479/g.191782 Transcript_89479/m.191782 type:complete len:189 (+) Transcript_89479:96-662(+)